MSERVWTPDGYDKWCPSRVAEKRYGELVAMLPKYKDLTELENLIAAVCKWTKGMDEDTFTAMCIEDRVSWMEKALEAIQEWENPKPAIQLSDITNSDAPGPESSPDMQALNKFIERLRRDQKTGMEAIVKAGLKIELKDLAFILKWQAPFDNAWGGFMRRINDKLPQVKCVGNMSFRLHRDNSTALLELVKRKRPAKSQAKSSRTSGSVSPKK